MGAALCTTLGVLYPRAGFTPDHHGGECAGHKHLHAGRGRSEGMQDPSPANFKRLVSVVAYDPTIASFC